MANPRGSASAALPKTVKGQATRSRIIDWAATLVFKGGVAHTSLDDVGAAAKVGKSQIYHYFADKSALVGEVIARQTNNVLAAQEPHLSRLDSWQSWQSWRDGVVHEQQLSDCRGGCPIGSIASELADSDENARVALVDSFDRWEQAFRDGIIRMRDNNLIVRDADPAHLATVILAALQGGLLLCKTRKTTAPLEASLDATIEHLRSFSVGVGS